RSTRDWSSDVCSSDLARHHRPGGVNNAKRAVALDRVLDDDAEAEDVGELLEAYRLALHLAPDRIGALAPADDLGGDAGIGKLARSEGRRVGKGLRSRW